MKRLLLPAVLGAAVLVAAAAPSRSAGTLPAAGGAETGESREFHPSDATPAPSPEAEARLARAELLAGLVPVEGPGLTVTLRNSPRKPPKGLDKSNLLLHDRDVNAVLNALRAAGAEALAVAGAGPALPERVTNNTVAVGARGSFLVNGTELKPPLRLLVIGDPATLKAELARKDGAVRGAGLDVLQMVEIAETAVLQIPAARHRLEFRFARKSTGEAPARVAVAPSVSPMPPVTPPAGERIVAIKPRMPAEGPASNPVRPREMSPGRPETTPVSSEDEPTATPSPARVSEQPAGKAPAAQPVTVAVTPRAKPTPPMGARPEPKSPAETVSGPVFGGKDLPKYHTAGCRFGERIERLQRVTYVSPEEARSKGRVPCSVCCGNR